MRLLPSRVSQSKSMSAPTAVPMSTYRNEETNHVLCPEFQLHALQNNESKGLGCNELNLIISSKPAIGWVAIIPKWQLTRAVLGVHWCDKGGIKKMNESADTSNNNKLPPLLPFGNPFTRSPRHINYAAGGNNPPEVSAVSILLLEPVCKTLAVPVLINMSGSRQGRIEPVHTSVVMPYRFVIARPRS